MIDCLLGLAWVAFFLSSFGQSRLRHASSSLLSDSCGSYVSIIVMVVSNYGDLATSFTVESCQHYYLVAPVFKGSSGSALPHSWRSPGLLVLQTMISQVILGVR